MPVTTQMQRRMVAALEAEEDRERQTLLRTHQRAHISSGGRIVRINGILTHVPHDGCTETIVLGMQIPSQPEIVVINRRRETAELLHPLFMLRPNLDDPFPTTPFVVLDPIPRGTIEYFSRFTLHATNHRTTRSSVLFPGYVERAPCFEWNELYFLHRNHRGQDQYYRLTDVEFTELNRRRIANLHFHQMQFE